jgi:predicted nucleic acid-binding protein
VVSRYSGKTKADDLVDRILAHFEVVAQDRAQFLRARNLGMPDFEDAVVASAAETSGCEVIVTRNIADFEGSPIPAITPEEFFIRL